MQLWNSNNRMFTPMRSASFQTLLRWLQLNGCPAYQFWIAISSITTHCVFMLSFEDSPCASIHFIPICRRLHVRRKPYTATPRRASLKSNGSVRTHCEITSLWCIPPGFPLSVTDCPIELKLMRRNRVVSIDKRKLDTALYALARSSQPRRNKVDACVPVCAPITRQSSYACRVPSRSFLESLRSLVEGWNQSLSVCYACLFLAQCGPAERRPALWSTIVLAQQLCVRELVKIGCR